MNKDTSSRVVHAIEQAHKNALMELKAPQAGIVKHIDGLAMLVDQMHLNNILCRVDPYGSNLLGRHFFRWRVTTFPLWHVYARRGAVHLISTGAARRAFSVWNSRQMAICPIRLARNFLAGDKP